MKIFNKLIFKGQRENITLKKNNLLHLLVNEQIKIEDN